MLQTGKLRTRWVITSLVIVGLTGGWFLYRKAMAANPWPSERTFIDAVAHQDWGTVYDLSPTSELRGHGIERSAFVVLMNDLSTDLSKGYFKSSHRDIEVPVNDATHGQHYLLLSFPEAPPRDGKPPQQLIRAVRSQEGWWLPSQELPLVVARWHREPNGEHWRRLARAMRVAGISEYPLNTSGLVVYRERLDEYNAGRAEYMSIYSR